MNQFIEKVHKIDKSLARVIRKKREKIQITNVSTERGDPTTDSTDIKRTVREYTVSDFMPIHLTTYMK